MAVFTSILLSVIVLGGGRIFFGMFTSADLVGDIPFLYRLLPAGQLAETLPRHGWSGKSVTKYKKEISCLHSSSIYVTLKLPFAEGEIAERRNRQGDN